jgi:hypothetical protein
MQDATGGMVPAAKLVLSDIATNDTRGAVTLESGVYSFVALSPGTYKLSVSKTGYKDTVFDSIVIHASRVTDLVATLSVGAVSEKVEIAANQTPLIEKTSSVLGATVDLKQIEDLPIYGRDPTQFGKLLAGEGNGQWNNIPGQSQVDSMDGVLAATSRFKGAGEMNSNYAAVTPRLQNVEEMTLQTSQLDANQGYGQGTMTATFSTRRGTNEYHGRVFDDMQNNSFNANYWSNSYNGLYLPKYHQNNFGGNVGGPILKNKLFFFAGYEQQHVPGSMQVNNSVLTPSMQAGNYTYKSSVTGNATTVNLFALAQSAGIQSTMDAGVQAELAKINNAFKYGTVGLVGGTDQYTSQNVRQLNFLEPDSNDTYYPTFRIDYNVRENLHVHFAYNETKTSFPTVDPPTFPGPDFTWQRDGNKSTSYTGAIGIDYSIRPTLINQFQGGYLYNYVNNAYKSSASKWGLTHDLVWWNGPWNLTYNPSGQDPSGDFFYTGQSNFYPLVSLLDNLIWQHGTHTFTFGGNYYHEQDHYWNPPLGYNSIGFGACGAADPACNVFSSSNPALQDANPTQLGEMQQYYAILTGDIAGIGSSHPLNPKTHTYYPYGALNLDEVQAGGGLFFEDSYRLKPNLTLNYGMRWDFTGDDHDLNGIYYSPTVAGLWGPTGYNNQFHPGSFAGEADPAYVPHGHAYAPWKTSPQPNFGFAWTPSVSDGWLSKLLGGEGTVVRGGFSLRRYTPQFQDFWSYASNYGSFFYQNLSLYANNAPGPGYFVGGTLHLNDYNTGSPAYTSAQWLTVPTSYQAQISESTVANQAALAAMNPHIAQPYTESWNFGIQRKIGQANALEVRYVGNRALHTWMALNPNEVNIFENGFLDQFKIAQQNLAANGGTSFQGPQATPLFDTLFSNWPQGGYTFGPFLQELKLGQAGAMAAAMASPFGATGQYLCNLAGANFSPCAQNGLWGYQGSPGNYPINFFQANPYFGGGGAGYLNAVGYSNYNSLQVEFRQQQWHGMQFTVNYTFGRALGMTTQYTLRNLRLAYGPTGADVKHTIHGYGTYDLPFGRGKAYLNGNRWLDRAVGGWTLGTITVFHSGGPFQMAGGNATFNNLFDGGIVLNGVTNKQLQHAIGIRKVPGGPANERYWIDPKYIDSVKGTSNYSYISPNSAPGMQGTRYWLHGLNTWDSDLSVGKAVPIKDKMKFSLQGEFLGVFNHPEWGVGDTGLQDSTFGSVFYPGGTARSVEVRANFEF